jgi:ribosomal protein S21
MVVNAEVVLRDHEDQEHLIKRFLKKIKKLDLMSEIKEKEFFISPSEKRHEQQKRVLFLNEKKAEEEREARKKG